jgi:hypothetical protein
MRQLSIAVLFGLLGVGLLHVFYGAVRLEWPSNYVTMTRSFGLVVNRSVQRYLLFILSPVYLVSLLMSTMAHREKAAGAFTALIIGLGHSFMNHGLPMVRAIRNSRRHAWRPDTLLQLSLAALSIAAALLGGLGPGPFGFVVPPLDEFFKAIWTAVFVAVLGVVVLDATRMRHQAGDLYDIAVREAPWRLVDHAQQKAKEAGADPDLVVAILYAENLQRPHWFRRLEYVKGRLFPRGSYGIMQVTSSAPIPDEESIDLAIENYLKNAQIPVDEEYGVPDSDRLKEVLRHYNDHPGFVDLASGLYLRLKRGY